MGDGQASGLSAAQAEAHAVLVSHFGANALTLLPQATVNKAGGSGTVGWSLPLPADHTGSERSLWIVLASAFPEVAPAVVVVPSAYGVWPHVTFEGGLCTWYDGMAPVGKSPHDQMKLVLERVGEILRAIYPTPDPARISEEFAKEWLSYWLPRDGSVAHATALLLDVPPPTLRVIPTHTVTMPDRRRFMLIGSDAHRANAWSAAFGVNAPRHDQSLDTLYVPLARPVIGAPTSLPALKQVLDAACPEAVDLLVERLNATEGPCFVVFGVVGDAPSFAALELTLVPDMRPQGSVRNAKEARNRRVRRTPDRWRVKVMAVDRADAGWIHGRALDLEAQQLAAAHVWVIGCGSLGGLVIRGLASAGIGRLTLVDEERLEVPNLGRHVLGVQDLGRYKATALAEQLRGQLPHLLVDAITKKYPHVRPGIGVEAPDLIVSATANWPADLRLMNALTRAEHEWVQLTWAEPHAVAGHSVLADSRSDPRALFSDEGRFLRETTKWPTTSRTLPGCAGTHQPGTFNRLQRIAGLAVEEAIAHLLGRKQPEHLAWLGDDVTLQRLGGSWRNDVVAPRGVRERTLSLPIPKRAP